MRLVQSLITALIALLICGTAFAKPSTALKIPVYCSEKILTSGTIDVAPDCFRVDTGESAFPVPDGMAFALTDIVTNRNSLISPGFSFFLYVRSSGGAPRLDFSGDQALSPSKYFVTPYIWVHSGDSILVGNGDISASARTVDVFLSGYLVLVEEIGY